MRNTIIIGSRGSALALIQAEQVKALLLKQAPGLNVSIRIIQTDGDKDQHSSLSEIGGKGVFIKAIEQELIDEKIDIAVHSLKDVTSRPLPGTELAGFLKPESQKDCLILSQNNPISTIKELPDNSIIATSSLRRKLLLQTINSKWQIKDIRGNVDTRIKKCKEGYADALILSEAGLMRLDREEDISLSLDAKDFLPAPGQGVVTVQCRSKDLDLKDILKKISNPTQQLLSTIEITIMNNIGLDCNYPLALHAKLQNQDIHIDATWGNKSLSKQFSETITCPIEQKDSAIAQLSQQIKETLDA